MVFVVGLTATSAAQPSQWIAGPRTGPSCMTAGRSAQPVVVVALHEAPLIIEMVLAPSGVVAAT